MACGPTRLFYLDMNDGFVAARVLGNASQEMPDDELVYARFVASEPRRQLQWMDRRMGFVALRALARIGTAPFVVDTPSERAPLGAAGLIVHQRAQIHVFRKLVGLRTWVRDVSCRGRRRIQGNVREDKKCQSPV